MGRQDWRTPPSVVRCLERDCLRGQFEMDVASSDENHLFDRYLTALDGPPDHAKWAMRNWCNPPFGEIAAFVREASEGAKIGKVTVMVTLANVSTAWFQEAISSAELILPSRRIQFWHPEEKPESPKFDSVFWCFGYAPGTVRVLEIPKHGPECRRLATESAGQIPLINEELFGAPVSMR